MRATPFEVVVFDFDGTLVQSAQAKRRAFFDIFAPVHARAVATVLASDPDGSRSVVIPEMLLEIARRNLPSPARDAAALIAAYGDCADARVAAAPEVEGASAVLRDLSAGASVYVASNTPHEVLVRHIARRGWRNYVTAAFGYPQDKTRTVSALLAKHHLAPGELLVVGDGASDEHAAAANGCPFRRVAAGSDLTRVLAQQAAADV